ncbi:hypothetical protein F5144DRAFT_558959 [Chaetomium tenue]|uniref:Uncharacterized protein n=1 Tax=Chaetomium tenue TaxID=1854479 RepID=A0ACB7PQ70_9PEZI|nr:hypothetical protein F5144DRAFT_558959 [Chaetomium globosum]
MSGHGPGTPTSSPPQFTHTFPEPSWLYPHFRGAIEGSNQYATYTQQGVAAWPVGWEDALRYGALYYSRVRGLGGVVTGTGSLVIAVLVAPFWDSNTGEEKNMIFMSTIPRGTPSRPGAYTRLSGPTGGHDTWRSHCYRGEEPPDPTVENSYAYVSEPHAEDNAINMYLRTVDVTMSTTAIFEGVNYTWLGGNFMVAYGLRARPRDNRGRPRADEEPRVPGQVLPCGLYAENGNSKVPNCRTVLDRMQIEWRFGIASDFPPAPPPVRPPFPGPQLPPHPPNDGSSQGGGSGQGGGSDQGGGSSPSRGSGQGDGNYGGDHPASGYMNHGGSTNLHIPSNPNLAGDEAARAYARQLRQWITDASNNKGKDKGSNVSRGGSNTTNNLARGTTSRPSTTDKPPATRVDPPTDALAKLSLKSTKTPTQLATTHVTGTVRPSQSPGAVGGQANTSKKPAGSVSAPSAQATRGRHDSAGAAAAPAPSSTGRVRDSGSVSGGGGGTRSSRGGTTSTVGSHPTNNAGPAVGRRGNDATSAHPKPVQTTTRRAQNSPAVQPTRLTQAGRTVSRSAARPS